MIADNVVVVLEMLEHLLVASLGVAEVEAVLDLDGVAGPVQRGRLAQQRAAAAVEETANDLVLGIVVGRPRIFVEIKAREAADAATEGPVVRVGKPLHVEGRQSLAVVQPVEHDRELLVVHSIPSEGNFLRPGGGVLPEVPLPGFLVEPEDAIGCAEGVQNGPVRTVLDGVVGSVIAAPAFHTQQIAALIEVALEELLTRRRVGPQQLPFE